MLQSRQLFDWLTGPLARQKNPYRVEYVSLVRVLSASPLLLLLVELDMQCVHHCAWGTHPSAHWPPRPFSPSAPVPTLPSDTTKGKQLLYAALQDTTAVLSMALWRVIHTLFILLVCIASPRIVPSPKKDTNGIDSLNLSVPESHITTLNQTSSSNLSWSAQYASTKPVKINTSLIPAGNVYNLTNLRLATPRVQCNGASYGPGLNIDSCIQAWGLLPISTTRRPFGKRTLGTFDVPLPFRTLSSEYDLYSTRCHRS